MDNRNRSTHTPDHRTTRIRCALAAAVVVVAFAGAVYSPARISGLAPGLDRLAWPTVAVRGWDAVPRVDLAVSRRAWGAVAVVTTGAALSGLDRLASRWRVVVGMGHGQQVRAAVGEVEPEASWGT